jgi:hypothetical protein
MFGAIKKFSDTIYFYGGQIGGTNSLLVLEQGVLQAKEKGS